MNEEKKSVDDFRFNKTVITSKLVSGNRYFPYTKVVESLYGENSQKQIRKFNKQLPDCFIKIKNVKYISVHGLSYILSEYDDLNLTKNIMSQLFRVKTKEKLTDRIDKSLNDLGSLFNTVSVLEQQLNSLNNKQQDILHLIESCEDEDMDQLANDLRQLRIQRRSIKNQYTMLKYIRSNLATKKVNARFFIDTEKRFKEIRTELNEASEHHIYFNKDGSNKKEMEKKISSIKKSKDKATNKKANIDSLISNWKKELKSAY